MWKSRESAHRVCPHPFLCLPVILPLYISLLTTLYILVLVFFVSTLVLILSSFHPIMHFALFAVVMQGTSYPADQHVGEVTFSSGFHRRLLAMGRHVELCVKEPQGSYADDRFSAWNKKRMILGKRLSAFFLITLPTKAIPSRL